VKGTSFPPDFQPNQNNCDNALRYGVDLREAVEAFRDHHMSKGNKFVNWNLALNTWIRNDAKFSGRKPVSPILDAPDPKYSRALDAYLARPPLRSQ
jgi:hypothetical protein